MIITLVLRWCKFAIGVLFVHFIYSTAIKLAYSYDYYVKGH